MAASRKCLWDAEIALMMEELSMSQTSVNFYETTLRNIRQDSYLRSTVYYFGQHLVVALRG
jgi:hypothetical protein